MIYVEVTLRIAPDKVKEFKRVFEEEYLPLRTEYGVKLVGQWETVIGPRIPTEITNLWAYQDEADRQKVREALAKDQEYLKAGAKLISLISEETIKMKLPLPCSPLK